MITRRAPAATAASLGVLKIPIALNAALVRSFNTHDSLEEGSIVYSASVALRKYFIGVEIEEPETCGFSGPLKLGTFWLAVQHERGDAGKLLALALLREKLRNLSLLDRLAKWSGRSDSN